MAILDHQRFWGLRLVTFKLLQVDVTPSEGLSLLPHRDILETTKTGKSDDSVLLGDQPHNAWLGECLKLYMKTVDSTLFPNLNLHGFEDWCKRACMTLQYQSVCIMPHVIRHSGASNDAFHGRRPLQEIQKRGRWAAKASVTRYEKHALLLASWRQCAKSRKQLVQRRSQSFPSEMVKFLRHNG